MGPILEHLDQRNTVAALTLREAAAVSLLPSPADEDSGIHSRGGISLVEGDWLTELAPWLQPACRYPPFAAVSGADQCFDCGVTCTLPTSHTVKRELVVV